MEQGKETLVKVSRVAALPLLLVVAALGEETALDRYVKKPDASYRYDIVTTARGDGTTRPRFTWTFEANGDIRVVSKDRPGAVRLWQATNAENRDFRLMTIGPAYRSADLQDQGGGIYVGRVPQPEKGWTAYFVELTYPSGGKYPFKFTTAVRVIPDAEPFPAYQPKRDAR